MASQREGSAVSGGPKWLVADMDGLTEIVSPDGMTRLSVTVSGATWRTREKWEQMEWEAAHRIAERLNRTEGESSE